jgi:hypothetical protein
MEALVLRQRSAAREGDKMKWTLIVMVIGHPVSTGLVYDTIAECYNASERMIAEEMKVSEGHSYPQDAVTRGICVPHVAEVLPLDRHM